MKISALAALFGGERGRPADDASTDAILRGGGVRLVAREVVGCRFQRRDVDVEVCLGCPYLREVDTRAVLRYVVCDPPSRPPWDDVVPL